MLDITRSKNTDLAIYTDTACHFQNKRRSKTDFVEADYYRNYRDNTGSKLRPLGLMRRNWVDSFIKKRRKGWWRCNYGRGKKVYSLIKYVSP